MKWPARWRKIRMVRAAGALLVTAAASVAVASSAAPDRSDRAAGDRPAGDGPAGDGAARPSPGRVILPGRPGEPAVVASGEIPVAGDTGYAASDAEFVRMMIPHHLQAVEMAALAPSRTRNRQLLSIAGRVRAAQLAEIGYLRAWLQARGLPESDEHAQHGGMRGMQTPAALRALAAARDAAFDRMFVAMMSAHHQGAIDMATDALTTVHDVTVEELATGIAAEQAIEISRMRDLVDG
jgi:uncharacterized protein (DUF305 family)